MQEHERSELFRKIQAASGKGFLCYTAELAKRFVADFPDSPYIWIYLGDSLYGLARYSEALEAFRHALRLCPKPKRFMVHARLGHLYAQKGDFRRAESWYRKAVAGNPSDAGYRVYLGGFLAIAGRLHEAEAVHRRATLCKKGCIDEAYLNLGLVLRAQERYGEALKCFQKALKLDPHSPNTACHAVELQIPPRPTNKNWPLLGSQQPIRYFYKHFFRHALISAKSIPVQLLRHTSTRLHASFYPKPGKEFSVPCNSISPEHRKTRLGRPRCSKSQWLLALGRRDASFHPWGERNFESAVR